MRIGLLARTRTRLLGIVAAVACATVPLTSHGQSQNAAYGRSANAPAVRPMQALYTTPGHSEGVGQQSSYVDSYGNPLIEPAGYNQQCGCGGGGCGCNGCNGNCGGGGCNGGYYGPDQCCGGGYNSGTDPAIGYELMNDVGMEGDVQDQRGPHYFDFRAEAVYLHRNKTFSQDIEFTSLNVGNTVVLSSGDLDFDDQPGFRLIGRYDICPLAVVEFGYTGVFGWESEATANDPTNNLYSLFSRPAPGTGLFGVDPIGVNIPGGPMPESERASQHRISLDSDLQSAEISYRRYWLGYSPRISGTLLAGFRYTKLEDNFQFSTVGSTAEPLAALNYNENCDNNLAGFQAGGDIWISLTQGLRIGSEVKAGIYNNHYSLTNRITTFPTGTTPPSLLEELKDDKAAFLTEGSVDLVADVLPSVSLRVGYEVLFMDSLVLAGDNFNQTSPYGNQGARVPFVVDDGELFYHGAHAGIEYIW